MAFIYEFETQYTQQNCVYPHATAISVADSSDPAVSVDPEGVHVRLKTIDMSVEDEMLCQLELDVEEYVGDTLTGPAHHHPHYALTPRAVRITSALLRRALKTNHAEAVGRALGGLTCSMDDSVNEAAVRLFEISANRSRWDEWAVLRNNDVSEEHIFQCSYLLLDWLESRADSLFAQKTLHALQEVMARHALTLGVYPQWTCPNDSLSGLPSSDMGSEGGGLADTIDAIDGVLRRHMSRYEKIILIIRLTSMPRYSLLLLDTIIRLITVIATAESSFQRLENRLHYILTFVILRLAIACCPSAVRKESSRRLLSGRLVYRMYELHFSRNYVKMQAYKYRLVEQINGDGFYSLWLY